MGEPAAVPFYRLNAEIDHTALDYGMITHNFVLFAFILMMATAAFEDFRRFIIPNPVTLGLCILWPLYFAAAPSLAAALAAIGCGAAVFVVGALLFARGFVGGGDVKLLAAAALWAGPAGIASLLLLTGFLGGVLALFLLIPAGSRTAARARAVLGQSTPASTAPRYVPYGIPIAIAAVIVVLSPNLV
jgi:prepilin peptidase CpaA